MVLHEGERQGDPESCVKPIISPHPQGLTSKCHQHGGDDDNRRMGERGLTIRYTAVSISWQGCMLEPCLFSSGMIQCSQPVESSIDDATLWLQSETSHPKQSGASFQTLLGWSRSQLSLSCFLICNFHQQKPNVKKCFSLIELSQVYEGGLVSLRHPKSMPQMSDLFFTEFQPSFQSINCAFCLHFLSPRPKHLEQH